MNDTYRPLYRSESNRMLGGVCGGLGDYLNMDPTVIRLIFLLLLFTAGPVMLLAYVIMLLVVPSMAQLPK
jgi:phage shock protein C